MKGYIENIEQRTLENSAFRTVLYTTNHLQLVVMSLRPSEEIGLEVHDGDQFIRIEAGNGKAVLNGTEQPITDGSVIIVPAGTEHNIINTGATPMKLYTLYAPPHHRDGTVHETKEIAETDTEHFDGNTSN